MKNATLDRIDRRYWAVSGLILLASLPVRFATIRESLWLDEAWVANSLFEPSLRQTLYFDRWAQSTPPLFLVFERWLIPLAGSSEAALRIVPWLCGFLGLILAAVVLRRLFSRPVAWLGFSLIAANYWLIKYTQQVKHYGSEFLAACVFLFLIESALRDVPGWRRDLASAAYACASVALSFCAVFWLPSSLAAAALSRPGDRRNSRVRRVGTLGILFIGAFLVEYWLFIRPNAPRAIFRNWAGEFLDVRHPLATLSGLLGAFGVLLTFLQGSAATLTGAGVAALMLAGCLHGALAGDRKGLCILLGGALPVATAIAASAIRQYPILGYPRMLLWALPCFTVLLCATIEPVLERLAVSWLDSATAALCVLAVAASCGLYATFPRAAEKNRNAAECIRSNASPGDLLFVHGGMYEQFRYYERELSWSPANVYIGSTDWPCCALGVEFRATTPEAGDFASDLQRAARRARGRSLWLLLPGAEPGHWSATLGPQFRSIPEIVSQSGCAQKQQRRFGQALVLAYACN